MPEIAIVAKIIITPKGTISIVGKMTRDKGITTNIQGLTRTGDWRDIVEGEQYPDECILDCIVVTEKV